MREGVFEHMKPIPTLNRQPVLMNAVQKVVSLVLPLIHIQTLVVIGFRSTLWMIVMAAPHRGAI